MSPDPARDPTGGPSALDNGRCEWCGEPLSSARRAPPGTAACDDCGSWTTHPAPTAAELQAAYGAWYRPTTGRFAGPLDRLLRRARERLADRIDELAPPGPVLDVGSGDGALLDAIERRGRQASGLERAPSSDRRVRARGIGELEDGWAAIVFWHSIEHLPGSGLALSAAAERLAPDGLLIVAAPNPASLQALAFGGGWLALDLPRHLVHVPTPALLGRIEAAGLRVERVSYLRGGQVVFGWLDGLVGLLPGGLDLYGAIRRGPARRRPLGPARRLSSLLLGALLLPLAALLALTEAALRRGGTSYVEARRGAARSSPDPGDRPAAGDAPVELGARPPATG